ncbi:MAG TPA: hypothetical protein H9898_03775 [Candidatus Anaerobiospirillum stercoravium]|nr:hypothetical protein [Candidatus Anaerobiospirillum stercoravium]
MLSSKERAQSLYQLSFNRGKAARLFVLCLAACLVGLSALYWMIDYDSRERNARLKAQLLSDIDAIAQFYHYEPLADLYEGVVAYRGKVDFDQVTLLGDKPERYHHEVEVSPVKGQKRSIGRGVYELRFVPVTASAQSQAKSSQAKSPEAKSS